MSVCTTVPLGAQAVCACPAPILRYYVVWGTTSLSVPNMPCLAPSTAYPRGRRRTPAIWISMPAVPLTQGTTIGWPQPLTLSLLLCEVGGLAPLKHAVRVTLI